RHGAGWVLTGDLGKHSSRLLILKRVQKRDSVIERRRSGIGTGGRKLDRADLLLAEFVMMALISPGRNQKQNDQQEPAHGILLRCYMRVRRSGKFFKGCGRIGYRIRIPAGNKGSCGLTSGRQT